MRSGSASTSGGRFGLVPAIIIALACALLWNVVLLNQKVSCDMAANRLKADASLTINTLRDQNEQLKSALADADCSRFRDENEQCQKDKEALEKRGALPCIPAQPVAPILTQRKLAVILFCYNRPEYLERALNSLLKYLPAHYALIVSQDSNDHKHTTTRIDWKEQGKGTLSSYYFISSHYRFGLSTVFDKLNYDGVIILEDDLEIAPDFFSYFEAMLPIMASDPSLYCISAWNDNGNPEFIDSSHNKELRRSDFFPGLGWLMTRELWQELGPRWPDGFWDDWMRLKEQRHGRHCIYPEVSRTYTFGAVGSSQGQFFKDHLASIVLNQQAVDWSKEDISYLKGENWDRHFEQELNDAPTVISGPADLNNMNDKVVSVYYDNEKQFAALAANFKIMQDLKEGIPRTAYRGVIKFHARGNVVFLRPRTLPPPLKM